MKIDKNRIETGLVLLFLFCLFAEILTFPDTWILIGGSIICAVLYARQDRVRVDVMAGLLALTIIIYIGMDKSFGIASITPLTYIIPIVFVMMNYLASEIKNNYNDDKFIIVLILVMTIGLSLHGLLNSYMWLDGQWYNGDLRNWMDFWSGEYKYAAWQNSYYLPAMALALPAIIYWKKRKCINLFIVFSAIFFVWFSLISQSRVTALMFPLVIGIQSIAYIILERKQIVNKIEKKHIIIGVGVFVTMLLCAIVFIFKSSIGQEFLSIMGRDGGIFNNIRFKFQRHALAQLFTYPFGGRKMDFLGYGHAHNAWIDIADAAGVIPFIAFIIYTIYTIYELICILRKQDTSTELKLMVLGIYICFMLFFTIESALESYGRYILPWIFLHGLVHGYLSSEKAIKEK